MSELKAEFQDVFGRLFPPGEWPPGRLAPLLESLRFRELSAGEVILREGETCSAIPFVTWGRIRVFKRAESGREISLYRVERGQSCILSSGCLFGTTAFPAIVVAETDARAAFLPSFVVERLLRESEAFRAFVLEQYAARMAEVMELVEEVAFQHVDRRLKLWLLERLGRGTRLLSTHREIADELGTSREVVSRILKDWEGRGAIEIARGEIRAKSGLAELEV